jgi:hypothetical protein
VSSVNLAGECGLSLVKLVDTRGLRSSRSSPFGGDARYTYQVLRAPVYSGQLASALSQSGHHDRHRCLAVAVKPAAHCPRDFVESGWQVARWLACSLLQAFGPRV